MEYINIGTANSDIVDQGRFSEKKKKKVDSILGYENEQESSS